MTGSPARFVVLEGGDAGGKSTQAARLAAALRAHGVEVVETFEPGATEAGAEIRRLVLHGPDTIPPAAEALLMAADRAIHVADVVAPALARGAWVVSDRYLPSSLVYQGIVRGLGVEMVDAVNQVATAGVAADLVIVLDVADDVAAARAATRPDRLEREGAEFHQRVREGYRVLASERGWAVVDAGGTVEDVAARVWACVDPLLGS